ncbi:MAG TPA: hypothetical protein VG713_05420 [Pirellulales bacterium]|nr:hypothetical protein [Pirellulales bacterium]
MASVEDKTTRDDNNRFRRLSAIRHLERLLAEAVKPDFNGSVVVEIPVKDGRLGRTKATSVRFDHD